MSHPLVGSAMPESLDDLPDQAAETIALLLRLRAQGMRNTAILRAIETVPRSLFVPERYRSHAFRDMSLPIACGQTISSAMALARLLDALIIAPDHRILEIGTGSGYCAAIMGRLAREIVSIERISTLVRDARARMPVIDVENVALMHADGLALLPDIGRFDRIVLHGVVRALPQTLTALLRPLGAIVYAEYERGGLKSGQADRQNLIRLGQDDKGNITKLVVEPTLMQPLKEGISGQL